MIRNRHILVALLVALFGGLPHAAGQTEELQAAETNGAQGEGRPEAAPPDDSRDVPLPEGSVIGAATTDTAWRALFDTVAAQGAVFSTFTERRWFSVRKEPVELQGELRHSPGHGLSLRYVAPQEQMMIIDDKGIVLRNAAGRSRSLKTDPKAPQVDAMLLHVLRFDIAALDKLFEIRGAREGDRWRLDFEPRSRELSRAVGHLTVEGRGETVRRLEFSRGPKQRVEVSIGETTTGVEFTAGELAKYFR